VGPRLTASTPAYGIAVDGIEILRAGLDSPILHEYTLEEYCL
jgi:hypothetical protein